MAIYVLIIAVLVAVGMWVRLALVIDERFLHYNSTIPILFAMLCVVVTTVAAVFAGIVAGG